MQNALQPIQQVQWHLVVLVLFLQKLNSRASPLLLKRKEDTDLKRDLGNTEGSLCDLVQLKCVNVLMVSIWEKLRTDLRECSSEFNPLFQSLLRRFCHQWGVTP
jgi:hypothetical protein